MSEYLDHPKVKQARERDESESEVKNKPLTMKCSHCQGKGVIRLTGVYADTLQFLREQSKPLNGAELARMSGVNVTAMDNRLVWLERNGFAIRERYGAKNLWSATS